MGRIYITVSDEKEKKIDRRSEELGFKDRSKYILSFIDKDLEQVTNPAQPVLKPIPALPDPHQVKVANIPAKRRRIVMEARELWKQGDPDKEPTPEQIARVLEALYVEHGVIGGYALWIVRQVLGEMQLA